MTATGGGRSRVVMVAFSCSCCRSAVSHLVRLRIMSATELRGVCVLAAGDRGVDDRLHENLREVSDL